MILSNQDKYIVLPKGRIALSRLYVSIIMLLCMVSMIGCTASKVLSIKLDNAAPDWVLNDINIGKVAVESGAPRVFSATEAPVDIGFSQIDLSNIKNSIEYTLGKPTLNSGKQSSNAITLNVIVRKYLITFGSHRMDAIACISWCATNPKNEILVQEQFYSTASAILIFNPPMIKNRIQSGVVKRICQNVVEFGKNRDIPPAFASKYENTYAVFEDAVRELPEGVSYSSDSSLSGIHVRTPTYGIEWEWVNPSTPTDWNRFLTDRKPDRAGGG